MKLFYNLFGMTMAGVLGYLTEPSLRFQLTGQHPSEVERGMHGKLIFQYEDGTRFDPSELAANQLPDQVRVDIPVKVKNATNGNSMTVDGGSRVHLLRIKGANAVVSPADGFEGLVPVLRTDLSIQFAAHPPTKKAAGTPATVPPPDPVKPPYPVKPPETVTQPEVTETPTPEPVPEVVPVRETAVTPEPVPTPEPESAPLPEPEKTPAPTTAGNPVATMQASIKAGQIKEFTADQVQDWKAGPDEEVDGETYQTGLASYKAETIFGVKTIQAKALIKGGIVQRWIWPKSGMEIK